MKKRKVKNTNKFPLFRPPPLEKLLVRHNRFFILTHSKPDGDAVASAASLLNFLRENGKDADLYFSDFPPDIYGKFLPADIYVGDKFPQKLTEYQTTVILDTGNEKRIGIGESICYNFLPRPILNIDHHPDNVNFGDYNYVAPHFCSTAAILYKTLKNIPEMRISARTATLLLLGIITDTGALRFQNTTTYTFSVISDLMKMGGNYSEIITSVCYSKSLNYIKMEADLVLNHLKISPTGRYAWIAIPCDMLKKYNVDLNETEGLIDSIRAIKGVHVIALLYKMKNAIKISLRSKTPDIPIAAIARKFNGGGHELAAGGIIKGKTMAEAERILAEEIESLLESSEKIKKTCI